MSVRTFPSSFLLRLMPPRRLVPFNTLSGQPDSSVFMTNKKDSEAGDKGPCPCQVPKQRMTFSRLLSLFHPFLVLSRAQDKTFIPMRAHPITSSPWEVHIHVQLDPAAPPILPSGPPTWQVISLEFPWYMNPLHHPRLSFPFSSFPLHCFNYNLSGRPRRHSFLHFKSSDLRSRNSKYCP